MALQDVIAARLADLQTQLASLDAHYAQERAAIIAKGKLLKQAAALVTPEIQTVIDQLGLEIPVV